MSVYAYALAAYSVPYLPEPICPGASHAIASLALIALGIVNFAGAGLMERLEGFCNAGKLIGCAPALTAPGRTLFARPTSVLPSLKLLGFL